MRGSRIFVRGADNVFLVDEGKRIHLPLSSLHWPASKSPFLWRVSMNHEIGPTLDADLAALSFSGYRARIAKEYFSFVIYGGGGGVMGGPPSGSAHDNFQTFYVSKFNNCVLGIGSLSNVVSGIILEGALC